MRKLATLVVVLASACVHGEPVGPDWRPCPDVIIYATLPDSTAVHPDSALALTTDSIDHDPVCS